jgi:hypothetical protein
MKKIIKYVASFFFIFLFFPVTPIAGEIVKLECTNDKGPFTLFFDSDGGKQQIFSITWNVAFTKDAIFGAIENGSGFYINFVTGEFYNNSHKIADCKFSNLKVLEKKNTEEIVPDAIEGKIIQLDEMKVQLDEMKVQLDEMKVQSDEMRVQRDEMKAQSDEMRVQRDEMKAKLNNYLLQNSSTEGSVEWHPIRCKYHGGWSGFIIYAQPFTSTNEFFTKHPDGKYSLSGIAVIDGKDLYTEIPITYISVKNANTWDVLDEGLNDWMGRAGDGDTVDQIGEVPKVSCLIDTIIPK